MTQELAMHQFFEEPAQPEEQRWSAIVPPQSALTFAVVWDDDGDMVSFSGAQLEDSAEDSALGSPLDVNDMYSRLSLYDPDNLGVSQSARSSSFFSALDRDSSFPRVGTTPLSERKQLGKTQTSSTLGGLDVYVKGSALGQTHIYRKRYTGLDDLGDGFEFDPRTSYAKLLLSTQEEYHVENGMGGSSDEDVTDSGCGVERFESMFVRSMDPETRSFNPVSSSNDQRDIDDDSIAWSRLDPPRTPGFNIIALPNAQPKTRRLRKRRPNPPPSNNIRRPISKYMEDGPCLEVPLSAIFRCKPVLKCRKPRPVGCGDDGSWVWVEAMITTGRL